MGGDSGLFAFDAGRGDLGTDVRRGHCASARFAGAGQFSGRVCRLDRGSPGRMDNDERRCAASRGETPLLRIHPPAQGSRSTMTNVPQGTFRIANRGPGREDVFEAREVVDGGFLELVRYGIRRADDPLIVDSLKVIDHVLKSIRPLAPAGEGTTMTATASGKMAAPYEGWGQGRAWPSLDRRAGTLRAGGGQRAARP